MGLICNTPDASPGYTLFSSLRYTNSYLIDNEGQVVHVWRSQFPPGNTQYLRDDGNLVRTADPGSTNFVIGGDAGAVQEFDWEGNLLWEFHYNEVDVRAHHDIALLPNSNILMIAWERKSMAEAIAAGRDPAFITDVNGDVYPEHLIEVQPVGSNSGNIVWQWHAWDHLIQDYTNTQANFGVVADHPELIDINFGRDGRADWMHSNAIDYHEDFDQILLSVPWHDEIWVIDHSTTTAEAAGHTGGTYGKGGDLLYRWGNPQAYDRGTATDQRLFREHGVHWIRDGLSGAGNILLFNNNQSGPSGSFSTVDEIVPPVDALGNYTNPPPGMAFGPSTSLWTYTATPPTDLFSGGLSGADRQTNGNTLICEGRPGDFQEVTMTSNLVWRYINPIDGAGPMTQGTVHGGNPTFRADRYPLNHPAFVGRDLTPNGTLELDPAAVFAFAQADRASSEATVSWVSVPDQTYNVQHSPSLVTPVWTEISTNKAIGTLTHYTDNEPTRLNQNPSFYQVVGP
jgi:hypothetical protein